MSAKNFRENARKKLDGKRSTMALIVLIEWLIVGAVSAIIFGNILIGGPIALGIAGCSLLIANEQDVSIENMFDGFGNFFSAFVLYLTNGLLVFVWSLLLIVPGIIKFYAYSMSNYILKENPNMKANDARKASIQMMQGNKWRLFCLHLSFVGWIFLSVLTFGILLLWIVPYIRVSEAEFYLDLKNRQPKPEDEIKAEGQEAK